MLDEFNRRFAILASAVRAASYIGDKLRNAGGIGLLATIDVTAVPGTDTVQLIVEAFVNGLWIILGQTAVLSTTGTRTIIIYPGAGTAANGITVSAPFAVPEFFRVRVAHSAASNF